MTKKKVETTQTYRKKEERDKEVAETEVAVAK